jgi:hypothetical protein
MPNAYITGSPTVKVGATTSLTVVNGVGGATWSSSNTAAATVDSNGVVSGVAAGVATIIYTYGADTATIQMTVYAAILTNGIDYQTVYNALKNRVLWRSQGGTSDSGRYYEDFHPLNDSKVLDEMRPNDGSSLTQYLAAQQSAVIMEAVSSIFYAPQMLDEPKLAMWRNDLTLPLQIVNKTGQFVGQKIYIGKGDFGVKLNSVQLFFTANASFNLYLYNDFFLNPILTIPVTCNAYNVTIINWGELVVLNNLVPTQYKGGRWYLGYYEDDLPAGCQSIYYPSGYNQFKPLTCLAFSAPLQPNPVDGSRNFNRTAIGANNLMYGINLEISTFIDETNKLVQNAHLLDDLLGYRMTEKSINAQIYSYQSNDTQGLIQSNAQLPKLYSELNGYKDGEFSPYVGGVKQKIAKATKTAKEGLQKTNSLAIGY